VVEDPAEAGLPASLAFAAALEGVASSSESSSQATSSSVGAATPITC
jgi:hypothetical protein